VKQIARVSIQSRDIPRRINAVRQRPLLPVPAPGASRARYNGLRMGPT
jgi:hypothetical protein